MTGLMGVGYPYQSVDIKYNKKVCGHIAAPNHSTEDNKWGISFQIVKTPQNTPNDTSPNCPWKWVRVKTRFDNEQAARDWINANVEMIVGLGLYFDEEGP